MTQPVIVPKSSDAHWPLPADAFLSLRAAACLAVRAGAAACQACQTTCPAQALMVDADGPRLVAACLHCGRCASACPSGALVAEGFISVWPPGGHGPVEVECFKVDGKASPNVLRVPCLGGITPTLLLQWWQAAGDRPLTLVNRGGCDGCNAGGDGFVAQAALEQANQWLEQCGVAAERRLNSRRIADADPHMPPTIPITPKQRPAMSRRSFFRRVGPDVGKAQPVAAPPAGPRTQLRREHCALPARDALLVALNAIASRHGRPLPAAALPDLTVDSKCADHGLCAGLCPTGALQRIEQDGSSALRFDAARCVACRRCEVACPEQALHLGSGGGTPSEVTVRTTVTRSCLQCGSDFPAQRPGALCSRCAASQSLGRSIFGTGVAGQHVETS